jgi:membrane protein insertase Oxa1/YidC/SpoIIIJ
MYWCTNNAISIVQGFVFKQPSVRAALKIPKIPVRTDNPGESPFSKFYKVIATTRATIGLYHIGL